MSGEGNPQRGPVAGPRLGVWGRSPEEAEAFCLNRYTILSVYGRKFNELYSTHSDRNICHYGAEPDNAVIGWRANGVRNLPGAATAAQPTEKSMPLFERRKISVIMT